jgi:hypothetical protein
VIVPVLDAASELPGLTEALSRQSLSAREVEILYVDNGSRDGSAAWIKRHLPPHGRLLASPTARNAYAARNIGVGQARGSVLAFTDADCRPDADWLERGVEATRFFHRVAGRIVVKRSAKPTIVEDLDATRFLRQEQYVDEAFAATANLFVRRSVFDTVGVFDDRLVSGGDQEFGARAQEAGLPIAYAPGAVVWHVARRRLVDLMSKAHRVGVGFGQAMHHHSFDRLAGRERIAERLSLILPTGHDWPIARCRRLALVVGHAMLAVGTAVGCFDGYVGRAR